MSILDDTLNINIIEHLCKLYISKYGVNSNNSYNCSFGEIDNQFDETDIIKNPDRFYLYWAFSDFRYSTPKYELFISNIRPKCFEINSYIDTNASIIKTEFYSFRPCSNHGYVLSLRDIMNILKFI